MPLEKCNQHFLNHRSSVATFHLIQSTWGLPSSGWVDNSLRERRCRMRKYCWTMRENKCRFQLLPETAGRGWECGLWKRTNSGWNSSFYHLMTLTKPLPPS